MADNGKPPRGARGSMRAKAGLSAKAGRRKVYGKGKRKMAKQWGKSDGWCMMHDVKGSVSKWEGIRAARIRMPHSILNTLKKLYPNRWDFLQAKAHWHSGILDV